MAKWAVTFEVSDKHFWVLVEAPDDDAAQTKARVVLGEHSRAVYRCASWIHTKSLNQQEFDILAQAGDKVGPAHVQKGWSGWAM